MGHVIAVSGKGGVGKTTLCGLLIQYLCESGKRPVLAVDADANANLNEVLGVEPEVTLGELREEIERAGIDPRYQIPSGMTKQAYLEMRLSDAIAEEDDYDLMVMGRTQGQGCYCFVNGLVQTQVQKLQSHYPYIVVDNEAGMEHISRGILPMMEVAILVSDCSRRGVQAAGRIAKLVEERERIGGGFFGPGVLELCQAADIVYIGLHGANGEDGKIQAAFDLMGIKYTGTGYLSSAISMSKELTKKVLVSEGVPMPKGISFKKGHKIEYVPYPCVVKPCCGGSSVGVSIANNEEEFRAAVEEAFRYEDNILVEEYVKGREFSVAVLDGEALPVIEIEPLEGFYDYKNKYNGATKETCPANLPADVAQKMQRWAVKACQAVGIETCGRVDMLLNEDEDIFCLEINTLPGMTETSLIPQEAAAVGMSYDQLTQKIVEISMNKYNK